MTYKEPHIKRNYEKYHYYTLKLENAAFSPQQVADKVGLEFLGPVGELKNYYQFRKRKYKFYEHIHPANEFGYKLNKRELNVVSSMNLETLRKRHKKVLEFEKYQKRAPIRNFNRTRYEALGIRDPGLIRQWHIVP